MAESPADGALPKREGGGRGKGKGGGGGGKGGGRGGGGGDAKPAAPKNDNKSEA